jgi:uncharacterized membrane protein required for colicin V production
MSLIATVISILMVIALSFYSYTKHKQRQEQIDVEIGNIRDHVNENIMCFYEFIDKEIQHEIKINKNKDNGISNLVEIPYR